MQINDLMANTRKHASHLTFLPFVEGDLHITGRELVNLGGVCSMKGDFTVHLQLNINAFS